MENYRKHIEISLEIRFGKPIIKGTRITVGDVLGWLSAGMTVEEILVDFPQLNKEQDLACMAYAKAQTNNTQIV